MAKALRKSPSCINCGQALKDNDNFCPNCGQQNTTQRVFIKTLIKDFVDDYFTFDSRFFRSIIPLLFKPGFLTVEFNAGRRVRFIPPLRIYLVTSAIYFLIPSAIDPIGNEDEAKTKTNISQNGTHIGLSKDRSKLDFNLTSDTSAIFIKENTDSIVNNVLDSFGISKESVMGKIAKKGTRNLLDIFSDDGKRFVQNMKDKIPIMMFFLLPVFAFFLWLLYIRSKPYYVECLIFSLHFHSFIYLTSVIINMLGYIDLFYDIHSTFIVILIIVYLIAAMKKVFGQRYLKTIIKFMGLTLFYGLSMLIFYIVTALVTLMLY